jgi:hypothetical protein
MREPTKNHPSASRCRCSLSLFAVAESSATAALRSAFAFAWGLCDRYEQELEIIHIMYRWPMAFFDKAYTD